MGSRGIQQNLDVVGINTRIEKTPAQRAADKRKADLEAAARRDAPNSESLKLREEIAGLNTTISELRAELAGKEDVITAMDSAVKRDADNAQKNAARVVKLEEEVSTLKEKLEQAVGSEKKLPDVIGEDDLELENKPATARQLPKVKKEDDKDEEETDKES